MKTAAALLLFLASSGCFRQLRDPDCITRCGMRARFAPGTPQTACAELERGESAALAALKSEAKVDAEKLCASVDRWYLDIGEGKNFYGDVFFADCSTRALHLQTYDFGGVTHELAHVSEGCGGCQTPGWFWGLGAGEVDYHCKWPEKGFDKAIVKAREVEHPPAATDGGR